MEIVKQLNLNRNNQSVVQGSLICAKNIKLSTDGSFITNDFGFEVAIKEAETVDILKINHIDISTATDVIEGNIVGFINCPNEIVIFTDENKIYRLIESKVDDYLYAFIAPSSWKYNGGIVIGTYIYNINDDLIISFCEYGGAIDSPLQVININESSEEDNINDYSIAPEIPIANLKLIEKIKGSNIPAGVYYFFIRYEVTTDYYTKWIPIGVPQFALNLQIKNIINHWYRKPGENSHSTIVNDLYNNLNGACQYELKFNLNINKDLNYKAYQIAYILQTDNTIVGRIWNKYDLNKSNNYTFTFNAGGDEIGIDELLENIFNIYNVKNITSFDNKLYIANYKESNYNDVSDDLIVAANDIRVYQTAIEAVTNGTESSSVIESNSLGIWHYKAVNGEEYSVTVSNDTNSIPLAGNQQLSNFINSIAQRDGEYPYDISVYSPSVKLVLDKNKIILSGSNKELVYDSKHKEYKFYDVGRIINPVVTLNYAKLKEESIAQILYSNSINDYSTYNIDKLCRTLMPNEVYAFYIHYLKEDGTFTNGIPLKNKNYTRLADNDKLETKSIDELLTNPVFGAYATKLSAIRNNNYFKNKAYCEVAVEVMNLPCEPFSYYENTAGKSLFKTKQVLPRDNKLYQIGVRFENIKYPKGYVGCFFSYEKVETLSLYQAKEYVTDKTKISLLNHKLLKASEVETAQIGYNGSLFIPSHICTDDGQIDTITDFVPGASFPLWIIEDSGITISDYKGIVANTDISTKGMHGGIVMLLDNNGEDYTFDENLVGTVIKLNRNIYTKENKELVSLGYVITKDKSYYGTEFVDDNNNLIDVVTTEESGGVITLNGSPDSISTPELNYPSFIVKDKSLVYSYRIYIDGPTGYIREVDANGMIIGGTEDNPQMFNENNYAKIITTLKYSNFNLSSITIKKEPEIVVNVDETNNTRTNTIVSPINITDLIEFRSSFIQNNYKIYNQYSDKIKTNAIKESIIRSSNPIKDESDIIAWKKFNSSAYHVIDRNKGKITNIFSSGKSFFIHTANTLLVTSSDAKISADNTSITLVNHELFDLTPQELFTTELGYGGLKYKDCALFSQYGYIWYDTDHNKLFRYDNSSLSDLTADIEEVVKYFNYEKCYINLDSKNNRIFFCFESETNYLTLSFNTITNKFISFHNFKFNKALHTTENIYFNCNTINNNIYKYNKKETNYKDIQLDNSFFPLNDYRCYFDIIFNVNYDVVKVLESIDWVHEIIDSDKKFNETFMDFFLKNGLDYKKDVENVYIQIYSDRKHTDIIPLSGAESSKNGGNVIQESKGNTYKYPWYDKGVWHFNYFRAIPNGKENPTDSTKDIYNNPIDGSDNRTLLYGKYIIVRFIFNLTGDKAFKFDNINVNLSRY